jgi:RimJ/RimL family protein N-acetyltransferase
MNEILLETERLIIRAFRAEDAPAYARIKQETFGDDVDTGEAEARDDPGPFIEWSRLSHEWFPKMRQPPYGDRAVALKGSGALIGAIGYVPCLMPFDQIPNMAGNSPPSGYSTPEFGLFWMIEPARQRQGYASEAARAMIEHAFAHLNLKRIIATTEYDNLASQGVMRKAGMTLLRNPMQDPPWMQIVGVRYNEG